MNPEPHEFKQGGQDTKRIHEARVSEVPSFSDLERFQQEVRLLSSATPERKREIVLTASFLAHRIVRALQSTANNPEETMCVVVAFEKFGSAVHQFELSEAELFDCQQIANWATELLESCRDLSRIAPEIIPELDISNEWHRDLLAELPCFRELRLRILTQEPECYKETIDAIAHSSCIIRLSLGHAAFYPFTAQFFIDEVYAFMTATQGFKLTPETQQKRIVIKERADIISEKLSQGLDF